MAVRPAMIVKGYSFEQVLPPEGEAYWKAVFGEVEDGIHCYSIDLELHPVGTSWRYVIRVEEEEVLARSDPADFVSPELAIEAALTWIEERYEYGDGSEQSWERRPQETIALATGALERMNEEEWLQKEFGDDVTGVIMDGLTLLIEQEQQKIMEEGPQTAGGA